MRKRRNRLESATNVKPGKLQHQRNRLAAARGEGSIYHLQSKGSSRFCPSSRHPYLHPGNPHHPLGRAPDHCTLLRSRHSGISVGRRLYCRPDRRRSVGLLESSHLLCPLKPLDLCAVLGMLRARHASTFGPGAARPAHIHRATDGSVVSSGLLQRGNCGLVNREYLKSRLSEHAVLQLSSASSNLTSSHKLWF